MTPSAPPLPPPGEWRDPAALRGAMRRDLRRANTAVAVVLTIVLALALVAVFAGLRAERNQRRAETAEAENQERLRLAYTEEARAIRLSAEAGGRAAALNAITNAAAIHVSPALRTEAIASLALAELVPEGPLVPTARDLNRLLVDPQLRYYAYGDAAGRILLNSLATNRPSLALDPGMLGGADPKPVDAIDFSPAGNDLAACLANGTAVAWHIASGQPFFTNLFCATNGLAPTPLRGLAFSADGRQLIFSDPAAAGQIAVYDLATGARLSTGIKVWGKTFRLCPDFHRVALATDAGVEVLNYPDGARLQTLPLTVSIVTLEWTPDGRRLAVAGADGEIHLWDPASGAENHFAGHSEASIRLGFNSAGTILFSTSRDGTTRLWDVRLGRTMAVGQGFACTFSQDDQRLMYWKPWEGFGVWRVVPSPFYSLLECDKSAGPLYSIDLSSSGRWCAVTQGRGVRIWDLAGNSRETFVPGTMSGARFTVDEQALVVCETNRLASWPLSTNAGGEAYYSYTNAVALALPEGLGARAVSFSGDGHWAAVELRDRRLERLDLTGRQPPTRLRGVWGHYNTKGTASPTGAGRLAISPDGRWIATGFDFAGDGPQVWDADTGGLVTNLAMGSSVAGFSPDGRWLGLAGISHNSIWSVGDWRLQKMFLREESSLVHGALAFLPGEPVVAFSQTRQTVQLRNFLTDQPVGDLIAPGAQSVNSVRISADGRTLVMATASDMVEVWRLGEVRHQLAGLNLDWDGQPEPARPVIRRVWNWFSGWPMMLAILGGFALTAGLALLTLRRHRLAIERFVIAEAEAVQSHRALDLAKVELMHSQKMQALGTLATGISHDFNNLLSVIRMSNKLIGRQVPGDPEVQELVTDVEQAVLQGKSVVGSVLGYARNGRESAGPTDVSALIEETVSLLSREFLGGLALTLELEPGAPQVNIPRGPLEQVLMNLLVNASEAMRGHGRLRISLQRLAILPPGIFVLRPRRAPHYLEMAVHDSGPGIAPEIQGRLFEPFFTTKLSGVKAGTGLGLSLVYSIAQQAGLGLSVASEPGAGARFTVIIPVDPAAATATVRETHSVQTGNRA